MQLEFADKIMFGTNQIVYAKAQLLNKAQLRKWSRDLMRKFNLTEYVRIAPIKSWKYSSSVWIIAFDTHFGNEKYHRRLPEIMFEITLWEYARSRWFCRTLYCPLPSHSP